MERGEEEVETGNVPGKVSVIGVVEEAKRGNPEWCVTWVRRQRCELEQLASRNGTFAVKRKASLDLLFNLFSQSECNRSRTIINYVQFYST